MGGYEFFRRLLALSFGFASCLIGPWAYAQEEVISYAYTFSLFTYAWVTVDRIVSTNTGSGYGYESRDAASGGWLPNSFFPISTSISSDRSFSSASAYALMGPVAVPAVNAQTNVSATFPLDLDMGEVARAKSEMAAVYRYDGESARPLTITATLSGSAPATLGGGYGNPCAGGFGFCGFPPFLTSRSGVVRAEMLVATAEAQTFAMGLPGTGEFSQDSVSWTFMLEPSAPFLLHLLLFAEVGAGGVNGSAFGAINVAFDDASGLVSLIPAPEPSTYALMLAGLAFVGFMARRRKLH